VSSRRPGCDSQDRFFAGTPRSEHDPPLRRLPVQVVLDAGDEHEEQAHDIRLDRRIRIRRLDLELDLLEAGESLHQIEDPGGELVHSHGGAAVAHAVRQPVERRSWSLPSRDLCLILVVTFSICSALGTALPFFSRRNVLQQARRLLDDREDVIDLMGRPGDQAADQRDFSRLH
jgi:hypothetical protein